MNFDISDAVFITIYTAMVIGSYAGIELLLPVCASALYPFLFYKYRFEPDLLGKNIIYLGGLWLVYSLLNKLKTYHNIDTSNLVTLKQNLILKEDRLRKSLKYVSMDLKRLNEGYEKELDMFETIRSMSKAMDFDAIFYIFAQKLQSVLEFESCCFILFKIGEDNVARHEKCLCFPQPQTNTEFGDDDITACIRHMPYEGDDKQLYRVWANDKSDITVYCMRKINDFVPVLFFKKLSDTYSDEIKPVLLPFYLEMRKSYLFEQIRNLSIIDGLTGIYQRRHFIDCLNQEMEESAGQNRVFSILMMDIDNFKDYNDSYGHMTGDFILKEISSIILNTIRGNDLAGRFGGEEFIFFLYDTEKKGAVSMAQRLRKNIESHTFSIAGKDLKVTVSIGVAVYPDDAKDSQSLIESADKKMYTAKSSGKNRVIS